MRTKSVWWGNQGLLGVGNRHDNICGGVCTVVQYLFEVITVLRMFAVTVTTVTHSTRSVLLGISACMIIRTVCRQPAYHEYAPARSVHGSEW